MKLEKEDYIEPNCVLCGKPGEEVGAEPVPVGRILDKLREYEDRSDWEAVERHLKYWLAEAEANHDERGQLMLNNELMGYYRKQSRQEEAFAHADRATELVGKLGMEDTVTAGTTWVNAGTVREAFGDPVGGLAFFEMARANYEKNLSGSDGRLGGLYNNMALALSVCGRYDEAEEMFRKAGAGDHLAEHGGRGRSSPRRGSSGRKGRGLPGHGRGTAGCRKPAAERVLCLCVRKMRTGLRTLRIFRNGSGTDEEGKGDP